MMDNRFVQVASGVASLVFAGAALSVPCYQSSYVGTACSIAPCDTSSACNGTVVVVTDDGVFTTIGGLSSGRAEKTNYSASCYKIWVEKDAMGACTVNKSCNPTVDSSEATGAHCEKLPA